MHPEQCPPACLTAVPAVRALALSCVVVASAGCGRIGFDAQQRHNVDAASVVAPGGGGIDGSLQGQAGQPNKVVDSGDCNNCAVSDAGNTIEPGPETEVVFAYTDFTDTGDWTLNGTALQSGSSLALIDTSARNESGTAYLTDPVDLTTLNRFSVEFNYQLTASGGLNNLGDGLALVFQNSSEGASAVGGSAGGLGFEGLAPSIAVELDLWGIDDATTDLPHVGVAIDGDPQQVVHVDDVEFGVSLRSEIRTTVWVDYDASTNELQIYVAQGNPKPANPALSYSIDFPASLNQTMYVGLTAAAGVKTEDVTIFDFKFSYWHT